MELQGLVQVDSFSAFGNSYKLQLVQINKVKNEGKPLKKFLYHFTKRK